MAATHRQSVGGLTEQRNERQRAPHDVGYGYENVMSVAKTRPL